MNPFVAKAAIIIPAHGQPFLTYEALHSALAQITDFNYAVVVVNDGCPMEETHVVCQSFATAFPERIFYLAKRNSGLSAARNSGIEFALAAFPELEAVYFLDCDNRIGPHLLQRLLDALRASGPEVGWAYPDVGKFGFAEHADTSGPYSPLEHLFRNFCEAGSMASRRMLDAGIRFDTEMRQGVEDWEFWLQGLEKGFRGIHVPDTGFAYRRRGESMLVAAEREFDAIKRFIRNRHPDLYNTRHVLGLEVEARSRYAVFHPDTDTVSCFTATDDLETLTRTEFTIRLLRSGQRPSYGACPGQLIVMTQSLFEALRAGGILAGVLWTLECALARATIVSCLARRRPAARATIDWAKGQPSDMDQPADLWPETIWAVESNVLVRHALSSTVDIRRGEMQSSKRYHHIPLRLQYSGLAPAVQSRGGPDGLVTLCDGIVKAAESEHYSLWNSIPMDRYRSHPALPRNVYPELFNVPSVLPARTSGGKRHVAFILSSAEARHIKIAEDLARALMNRETVLHLVIFGTASPDVTAGSIFSETIVLSLPHLLDGVRFDTYQAAALPRLEPAHMSDAVGAMAAYDLVVNVEGQLAHSAMGSLKRLNVETWLLLGGQASKVTSADISACSAFEQAYRSIIVPDTDSAHLCRAFGIPETKLRLWQDLVQSDDHVLADIA
ncbi:glycosyltransferase family 2 protein [Phyllobacterium sp. 21LDTY02-6]|uniref:glycosyltransferase family 2 protein n=1 Tax=Phyllobacterium sp. 21LDTY02-6 TaxID=2944903 RepID=UPI0020218D62|nr:glycosyltransferase family A protein [Phyllobacterium sp. 21LDTY02-6]MCO4319332.1 glycosyltransferase family 2 protein [Phyllobacterium sp. 21LDTY02-6]